MKNPVAQLVLHDLEETQSFSIEEELTEELIDRFAAVSGDLSPLHMDAAFAQSRGFSGRVAHGVLLAALVSRVVGMHLPGENALLQTVNLRFVAPAIAGSRVRVTLVVEQISEATRTIVLRVQVAGAASGQLLATGKAHVGFTR